MDFREWLDIQLALQQEAFQVDPRSLDGEGLAHWVTWNVLAATDELHEFLNEVQWKPWANDMGAIVDREHALEELVDALHFIANLALALNASGDELADIYIGKVGVNYQRQEQDGGYDAIEAKCPRCHRDLVTVGRDVVPLKLDGVTMTVEQCGGCGAELSRKVK